MKAICFFFSPSFFFFTLPTCCVRTFLFLAASSRSRCTEPLLPVAFVPPLLFFSRLHLLAPFAQSRPVLFCCASLRLLCVCALVRTLRAEDAPEKKKEGKAEEDKEKNKEKQKQTKQTKTSGSVGNKQQTTKESVVTKKKRRKELKNEE